MAYDEGGYGVQCPLRTEKIFRTKITAHYYTKHAELCLCLYFAVFLVNICLCVSYVM